MVSEIWSTTLLEAADCLLECNLHRKVVRQQQDVPISLLLRHILKLLCTIYYCRLSRDLDHLDPFWWFWLLLQRDAEEQKSLAGWYKHNSISGSLCVSLVTIGMFKLSVTSENTGLVRQWDQDLQRIVLIWIMPGTNLWQSAVRWQSMTDWNSTPALLAMLTDCS